MWKKPLALLGASALVCAGEMARELSTFRVRRYREEIPGMERGSKIRMVFLSDLHGKEYGRENRRLLEQVEREEPDCILVGGDMLTRTQPETDRTAAALMRRLAAVAPVYAANGNHEQKMKENRRQYQDRYERYRDALMGAGVHLLENETCLFQKGSFQAALTGLEIPLSCYSHFGREKLQTEEIKRRIGEPEGEGTTSSWLTTRPAWTPTGTGVRILSCPGISTEASSGCPLRGESSRLRCSFSPDIQEICTKEETGEAVWSAGGWEPTQSMSVSTIWLSSSAFPLQVNRPKAGAPGTRPLQEPPPRCGSRCSW